MIPYDFDIETSTVCNLNCPFCFYQYMQRDHKFMDLDLYRKILMKLKSINANPENINVSGIGEPLLNPNIFELLDETRKTFPDAMISMNTNGTVIDQYLKELLHSPLDLLGISIRFSDRKRYHRFSGSDYYNKVVNNTRMLLNQKRSFRIHIQVFNTDNVFKFFFKWKLFLRSGDGIHINKYYDLVGWYHGKDLRRNKKAQCYQVDRMMVVDIDGVFHPCCEALWTNDGIDMEKCLRCPIA